MSTTAGARVISACCFLGKQLGVVDHFSLRQAFASGLTTVATAGLGIGGQANGFTQGLQYGAAQALVGIGAQKVAGIDDAKFIEGARLVLKVPGSGFEGYYRIRGPLAAPRQYLIAIHRTFIGDL